jgi:ankyrin repeat protein
LIFTKISQERDSLVEDIIKLLIEHKTDVNTQDINGNTPLHIACKKEKHDIIKLLLEHKTDTNTQDINGNTPLHISCIEANTRITILLIEQAKYINDQNQDKNTMLALVCKEGNYDIIKLLIQYGADIDIKNNNGASSLSYAEKNEEMKNILLNKQTIQPEKGNYLISNKTPCLISEALLVNYLVSKKGKHNISRHPSLSLTPLEVEAIDLFWHEKYRKHLIVATIISFFGSLGIFGILKYLQYKKNMQSTTE